MFTSLQTFFKNLLSSSDETSSKRFYGLIAMCMFVATHIESACGIEVDYQLTYMTLGLILGQSGLTVLEKIKLK